MDGRGREWDVPPSPGVIEALYKATRKQLEDLQDQVRQYLSRNKELVGNAFTEDEIMHPYPILQVYELYRKVKRSHI